VQFHGIVIVVVPLPLLPARHIEEVRYHFVIQLYNLLHCAPSFYATKSGRERNKEKQDVPFVNMSLSICHLIDDHGIVPIVEHHDEMLKGSVR
jgi:hypothetical protein